MEVVSLRKDNSMGESIFAAFTSNSSYVALSARDVRAVVKVLMVVVGFLKQR